MSDQYQCLQCWHRLEAGDAFYRCDDCEKRKTEPWMQQKRSSMNRVRDLPRSVWGRLISDGGEGGHPSCTRHRTSLKLFCEECRAPLSPLSRVSGTEGFGLGFAGVHGAGKTLLITTMVDRFRHEAQGGQKVSLLGIEDTEKRFGELAERLIHQRRHPQSTLPEASVQSRVHNAEEGQPRNFGWQIHLTNGHRSRPRQVGMLTVYDVAGETWSEAFDKRIELFDRYLSHLTALVFVIDGAPMADDLDLVSADAWDPKPREGDHGAKEREWLSATVQRLGERARGIDVALTVSKADLLWQHPEGARLRPGREAGLDVDRDKHQGTLHQLLAESQRGDLVEMARSSFDHVGLFAVSSLGFTPAPGDVQGDSLIKKLEPVDVVEPLRWLFGLQVPRFKS